MLDDPSQGLLRIAVNLRHLQRDTVAHRAVAAGAHQHDGVVGRGDIEVLAREIALLGEIGLGPAEAGDPLPGSEFLALSPASMAWMSAMDLAWAASMARGDCAIGCRWLS